MYSLYVWVSRFVIKKSFIYLKVIFNRAPEKIKNNFSAPFISLTLSYFLTNLTFKMHPPSKCSIAVFNNLKLEASEAAVDKLGEILKQVPHFVLIISNLTDEQLISTKINNQSPWVFSKPEGFVMSIVCPNSGDIVRKTWQQSANLRVKEICPHEKEHLKIAYNNESMPYFDLKDGNADVDTLEGAVLQIFLDKNNIQPVYMYGHYEWGSMDPLSGLWNGVVGMVLDMCF